MTEAPLAPVTGRDLRTRRGIWVLAAAAGISGVGNGIAALAIPWFVLVTTGSPAQTGLVAGVTAGGGVVAGILGGAAIDRLGFQRTSVLSDALSGISVLLIPLLHFAGVLEFWHILVLAAVGAFFDLPGFSARASMVPALSARASMPIERGNAILQFATNGAGSLLGPVAAGVLLTVFSAPVALYFDVGTFAIAIVLVSAGIAPLARAARPVDGEGTSYWREILDGAAHIARDPVLRAIFPTSMMANLIFMPFVVIFAVIARDEYDAPSVLGLFFGAFGFGALIGTVFYGVFGHRLASLSPLRRLDRHDLCGDDGLRICRSAGTARRLAGPRGDRDRRDEPDDGVGVPGADARGDAGSRQRHERRAHERARAAQRPRRRCADRDVGHRRRAWRRHRRRVADGGVHGVLAGRSPCSASL